mgnify:CR=1 FL=1
MKTTFAIVGAFLSKAILEKVFAVETLPNRSINSIFASNKFAVCVPSTLKLIVSSKLFVTGTVYETTVCAGWVVKVTFIVLIPLAASVPKILNCNM